MCYAKPGPRCHSHSYGEYLKAKEASDHLEVQKLSTEKDLGNVNNQIDYLGMLQEDGLINDEQYNNELDTLVEQRNSLRNTLEEVNKNYTEALKTTAEALNESYATKGGLKLLREEITNEKDPQKLADLARKFNAANRNYNLRMRALEKQLERKSIAEEMRYKAQQDLAAAQQMPEYDEVTHKVKQEVILNAEQLIAQSVIEENGGKAEFKALFNEQGKIIPAKIVKTKYGHAWGILADPEHPGTSRFASFVTIPKIQDVEKRREFYAKKGLTLGTVRTDAVAKIVDDNVGGKKVSILRTDQGYSPYDEIVKLDNYAS